jgi:hypothetical protein
MFQEEPKAKVVISLELEVVKWWPKVITHVNKGERVIQIPYLNRVH